jgi:methionine-rich copper-binding protein CopC
MNGATGSSRPHRLLAAVALMIVGLSSGIVSAHSGLGAASPAPGSTVGGEITEIQLRYANSVEDVDGSVTDPSGIVLTTEFVQTSALAVQIKLPEPLSVPGEYAVRHISTSVADGDRVEAAYLFTYEPDAAPPQLEILETDDGGRSLLVWIVLGVGVAVIAILAWRLIASARSLRQSRPTP